MTGGLPRLAIAAVNALADVLTAVQGPAADDVRRHLPTRYRMTAPFARRPKRVARAEDAVFSDLHDVHILEPRGKLL